MAKKIAIAGAGIGGLTAACCLLKAGYDVELFEQAAELSEIGAGIQLSANAMHVLNDLGLGRAIAGFSVRPGAYVFRLHDTGEVIGQFPLAEEHEALNGAPHNQLHRADLHNLLIAKVKSLKPNVIRLNSRVLGFEESQDCVELKLSDGSRERADILIGADGVKSAIRACASLAGPPFLASPSNCHDTFYRVRPAAWNDDPELRVEVAYGRKTCEPSQTNRWRGTPWPSFSQAGAAAGFWN